MGRSLTFTLTLAFVSAFANIGGSAKSISKQPLTQNLSLAGKLNSRWLRGTSDAPTDAPADGPTFAPTTLTSEDATDEPTICANEPGSFTILVAGDVQTATCQYIQDYLDDGNASPSDIQSVCSFPIIETEEKVYTKCKLLCRPYSLGPCAESSSPSDTPVPPDGPTFAPTAPFPTYSPTEGEAEPTEEPTTCANEPGLFEISVGAGEETVSCELIQNYVDGGNVSPSDVQALCSFAIIGTEEKVYTKCKLLCGQYSLGPCAESSSPSDTPTDAPSDVPTFTPTTSTSGEPTSYTTSFPTYYSTKGEAEETGSPVAPTDAPIDVSSFAPSVGEAEETGSPVAPTDAPSDAPTDVPTFSPTDAPSDVPTFTPTTVTTSQPTTFSTSFPTYPPTTDAPSDVPTFTPTTSTSVEPTTVSTSFPTYPPTTEAPSDFPSNAPTEGEAERTLSPIAPAPTDVSSFAPSVYEP